MTHKKSPHPQTFLTKIQSATTALNTTATDENTLLHNQAHALDNIFTTIIEEKVGKAFSGERYPHDSTLQWLTLALKAQKQCEQTIKAKAVNRYMNALSTPHTIPCIPDKQVLTNKKKDHKK